MSPRAVIVVLLLQLRRPYINYSVRVRPDREPMQARIVLDWLQYTHRFRNETKEFWAWAEEEIGRVQGG